MANVAAPFGLLPLRHKNGAPYNGACRLYYTGTDAANNWFIGDPVVVDGSGYASAYYGNFPNTLATVTYSNSGTLSTTCPGPFTGVIVGFFAEQASSTMYRAAGASRGVYVADDPDLVFTIMDDGLSALDASYISTNAYVNNSTYSGSTYTGISGVTMATASTATTATLPLKILKLHQAPKNAIGKNAVWEVTINYHTNAPNTAGI